MSNNNERKAFEAWWPTVGQTIGKVAAWEAWQARAKLEHIDIGTVCVPASEPLELELEPMTDEPYTDPNGRTTFDNR